MIAFGSALRAALAELAFAVLALLALAFVPDLAVAMLVIFTWVYFWRWPRRRRYPVLFL